MKSTDLNKWFKGLDSTELSFMFPGLYSEIMESADPRRCTVNHFIKEAKKEWNALSDEKKLELYNDYLD